MNEVPCIICAKSIKLEHIILHLPGCYRHFMVEAHMVPLCTCNACKATKTHPGDNADGTISLDLNTYKRPLTDVEERPSAKLPRPETILPAPVTTPTTTRLVTARTPTTTTTRTPTRQVPNIELESKQLSGTHCIVCNKAKTPNALPYPMMSLGRTRKMMICVKGHLKTQPDWVKCGSVSEFQVESINLEIDNST